MLNLGTPPKELGWLARLRLNLITRPAWLPPKEDAGLGWFLNAETDLKQNGIVVPGAFIQANSKLSQPGSDDLPGELVFSLAPATTPQMIKDACKALASMKGKEFADPEKSSFSRYLASEVERVKGLEISRRIWPPAPLFVSTTIVYRAHLPEGVLRETVFPVLVSPQSHIAMVLPQNLWKDDGHAVYERFK